MCACNLSCLKHEVWICSHLPLILPKKAPFAVKLSAIQKGLFCVCSTCEGRGVCVLHTEEICRQCLHSISIWLDSLAHSQFSSSSLHLRFPLSSLSYNPLKTPSVFLFPYMPLPTKQRNLHDLSVLQWHQNINICISLLLSLKPENSKCLAFSMQSIVRLGLPIVGRSKSDLLRVLYSPLFFLLCPFLHPWVLSSAYKIPDAQKIIKREQVKNSLDWTFLWFSGCRWLQSHVHMKIYFVLTYFNFFIHLC